VSASPGRYDPLPDLSQMPAWLWRRTPRAGKLAVTAATVAGVTAVLAVSPVIDRAKDERAQAETQSAAQTRAERIAQVRAEQQPRFAAAAPGAQLVAAARASVLADARGRVTQPILRVSCEPFPHGVAASTGRYACLAVTHEVGAGAAGYPYRVLIDHDSGRYAFCKVVGRPGEAMIATQPLVPLSRFCGGM
jgi:hypothetical protein